MSQMPETTGSESVPPGPGHEVVQAVSDLALRTEVSSLYHDQSTRMGPRSQFTTGPRQTYDRSLLQYEWGINELSSHGESLFTVRDWVDKVMLDIGSGGYDRAGMEARREGVRVISLNPALRQQDSRNMLAQGVRMHNQKAQAAERDIWARQNFIKRLFTKPATAPELQTESVAALGQALPLRDESVDVVVSLYGVPQYLHHYMFGPKKSKNDPKTLARDIELIATAFKEIERVLKPGGKAYLKDSYKTPLNPYEADESGVTEALKRLEGCDVVVHNSYDAKGQLRDRGGRVIELTKRAAQPMTVEPS